jgi:HNH endonuclease
LAALSTASSSADPSTGLAIPARSSSTRQKQLWQPRDAKRSRKELEANIKSLSDDIGRKAKKLKPSTSYDSDFWTTNADISRLCQQRAGMESRLQFLDYKEASRDNVSEDDWYAVEQAQNLERQILAYHQAEEIARKQASRLQESRTGLSAIFFSLFTSSPQGLNIKTGVGRRETSDQSNMVRQMREKYCPDAPKDLLWDPITGQWEPKGHLHAAHLYSWRQVDSMDAIFGPGAKAEIFSPVNGLFLSEHVEKALDQGLLALIPDVDLEPKDSHLPCDDLAERNQRLRDWEKAQVKEYKVVVLDLSNKLIDMHVWRDERGGDLKLKTLAQLDGRPLKFHTDFRPRARYVWWTFMNAILQNSWRQKQNEKNILRQEVAKATRYWGTRGRYVKKNMLRGFVDELGQDIESILENAIEDDDTGDADPDAVAVMASETVFRMQEAAKEDEDEDEDEDKDEDEDGDD